MTNTKSTNSQDTIDINPETGEAESTMMTKVKSGAKFAGKAVIAGALMGAGFLAVSAAVAFISKNAGDAA